MAGRRQNGEGTIYQRKNGLWVCELTIGYDENNKRIKKTLSNMDLDELKKKINNEKVSIDRGLQIKDNQITLNDWIEFWLKTYKKGKIKNTTFDNYYFAWECHIKNGIGKLKLSKVNHISVQAFVNEMGEEYSVSTIKKSYIVLNQCFEKAIVNNLIYTNPCIDIQFPKKPPKKVAAMTPEEQKRFESNCSQNSNFGRLFLFALNTGMRFGEILALTWDDVDFANKCVNVNKTIVSVVDRSESDAKFKLEIADTKTESGTRKVPLNKTAIEVLKNQKQVTSALCFESKTGSFLWHRNVNRALRQTVEKSKIETPVTMHVLRHSFATRLLEKGANIKAVSEILGHKSIQITLDIYSHVLENLQHDTVSLLDN